jgi:DNA-binding IclR family transcriptional regulator
MPAKTIKSVERAFEFLFLFDSSVKEMDVKRIAENLRLPLRTAYRFVATLRKCGVLFMDEATGRCRLSVQLRRLLIGIDEWGEMAQLALPLLRDLAEKSGETAQLMVLSGDHAVLVELAESPHALRVGPRKGQRIPLHTGAGTKAILAFQSSQEWDSYIGRRGLERFTPNTVTDPATLKRQLTMIRRVGFAVSHQEYVPGARALGAPIRDFAGRVTASVGLVGPDTRLTVQKARELKPLVLETARLILAELTGRARIAAH